MKRVRLTNPLFPDEMFYLTRLADGFIIQATDVSKFKYFYVILNIFDMKPEELEELVLKKAQSFGFNVLEG